VDSGVGLRTHKREFKRVIKAKITDNQWKQTQFHNIKRGCLLANAFSTLILNNIVLSGYLYDLYGIRADEFSVKELKGKIANLVIQRKLLIQR